jgi:hypothetical protein
MIPSLTDTQLAEFEKLGTCAVANAHGCEQFDE